MISRCYFVLNKSLIFGCLDFFAGSEILGGTIAFSDRVRSNQSYIEDVDPPPQGGGRLFGKYFDKHIRSEYFCYHSKEKVWADVLNTHNTTIWPMKNFLRRFEKKFENFWSQNMPRRCHNFIWLLSCFGWSFAFECF